jgi:imidazoleglycerol-phosphate dehydratase
MKACFTRTPTGRGKTVKRRAEITRKTRETDVAVAFSLDGEGSCRAATGIPFFDHMLTLMTCHGRFDAEFKAVGDVEVDFHHTVEDVGICLGRALAEALGDKKGISRYGQALVPMDEALAEVALDVSGRPYLVMRLETSAERVGNFDRELADQFFQAVATNAGLTLHVNLRYGANLHHSLEAVFKAFGLALSRAAAIVPGRADIPSSKGVL